MKMLLRKLLPGALQAYRQRLREKERYYRWLTSLDRSLIDEYASSDNIRQSTPIFIVASPRTGSTILYQAMCKYLDVAYFSNIGDSLSQTPLVSWMLAKSLIDLEKHNIICENEYGESKGLVGPSEASSVLANWFPYRHPTETCSNDFISSTAKFNMQQTFHFIQRVANAPVVTKNAWNCFRLDALQSAFPNAKYIHLQRNIIDSSYSTLLARRTQGDPQTVWNSASPRQLHELKKLPYYEQVVEQQRLTNLAVRKSVGDSPARLPINYEDFLDSPIEVMHKIADFCSVKTSRSFAQLTTEVKPRTVDDKVEESDKHRIAEYCAAKGYA